MGKKSQKSTGATPKSNYVKEITEPQTNEDVATPGDIKLQRQRERDERERRENEERIKAAAEKAKREAKSNSKKKGKKPARAAINQPLEKQFEKLETVTNSSGAWSATADEITANKSPIKLNRSNTYETENWDDDKTVNDNKRRSINTPDYAKYSQSGGRYDKKNQNKSGNYFWDNSGKKTFENRNKSFDDKGNYDQKFQEFQNKCDDKPIDYGKTKMIKGDLFSASEEYALAHCVAEDMAMGAGIARTFRTEFGQVGALLNQRQRKGGLAVIQHNDRYIYYLVTKEISRGKPTYYTLWQSLNKLKDHMYENNVTKLAIPQIGCGLDRLEWITVEQMIEYIFQDIPVEIVVYVWDETLLETSAPTKRLLKKCATVHKVMDLLEIEPGTGLVYFGYVDGYENEEFKNLASKYSISAYKQRKSLTDVIKTIDRGEYIYGLIIKESHNDEIDYLVVEKAVRNLKKQIQSDRTAYVGLQAFIDDEDKNLFYKMIALMQYIFFDVEIWICWPKKLEHLCPQQTRVMY